MEKHLFYFTFLARGGPCLLGGRPVSLPLVWRGMLTDNSNMSLRFAPSRTRDVRGSLRWEHLWWDGQWRLWVVVKACVRGAAR